MALEMKLSELRMSAEGASADASQSGRRVAVWTDGKCSPRHMMLFNSIEVEVCH
jgi:hypothetical protein